MDKGKTMDQNFRLFKSQIEPQILENMRENIAFEVRRNSHFYQSADCKNRGVYPRDRVSLSHRFPKEDELLKAALFKDDEFLKSGSFAVYFSRAAPDTSLSIHADMVRKCAINFNLMNCEGVKINFFEKREPFVKDPTIHSSAVRKDQVIKIDEVEMTENGVLIMNTKVYHNVPEECMKTKDVFILSYGWYTDSEEFSYDNICKRLESLGLLV